MDERQYGLFKEWLKKYKRRRGTPLTLISLKNYAANQELAEIWNISCNDTVRALNLGERKSWYYNKLLNSKYNVSYVAPTTRKRSRRRTQKGNKKQQSDKEEKSDEEVEQFVNSITADDADKEESNNDSFNNNKDTNISTQNRAMV